MGIQINGTNDTISAADGSLTVNVSEYTVGSGTSIFSPATNVLTLGTNNVERLRVDSNGNINLNLPSNTTSRNYGITNTAGTIGWTFGNGVIASSRQFVLYDNEAGAARFIVDSSGRMTIPSQPAFHAYINATQTIGTSGAVKILAQVADVNRGSVWNTSTSRFTAPVSGLYQLSASITFEYNGGTPGTDDSVFVGLYKNGSAYNFSNSNGTNPRNRIGINPQYYARDGVEFTQSATWLIQLNTNDYIEFYILDVNTSGPRIESCLLNGYLIG